MQDGPAKDCNFFAVTSVFEFDQLLVVFADPGGNVEGEQVAATPCAESETTFFSLFNELPS